MQNTEKYAVLSRYLVKTLYSMVLSRWWWHCFLSKAMIVKLHATFVTVSQVSVLFMWLQFNTLTKTSFLVRSQLSWPPLSYQSLYITQFSSCISNTGSAVVFMAASPGRAMAMSLVTEVSEAMAGSQRDRHWARALIQDLQTGFGRAHNNSTEV